MAKPAYVQGSSVGALSGAMYAQNGGDTDELESNWLEIERVGPPSVFNRQAAWLNILKLHNFVFPDDGISRLTDRLDIPKLIASDIEFRVVVRNETKDEKLIVSNHEDKVKDDPDFLRAMISASSRIPGGFAPLRVGYYYYSDGLVFDIQDAIDFGCDKVFLFQNDPLKHPAAYYFSRFYLRGISAYNYIYERFTASELARFKDVLVVFDAENPTIFLDRFKPGDITRAIRFAYQKGLKILESLDWSEINKLGVIFTPGGFAGAYAVGFAKALRDFPAPR